MAFDKERQDTRAGGRPQRRGRKKVCSFCVDRVDHIDYKDVSSAQYISGAREDYSPPRYRYPAHIISVS